MTELNNSPQLIGSPANDINSRLLRFSDFSVRLFHSIRERRRKRKQQIIDRLAFENYLTLDDAILADIGVTRDDVLRASSLALCVNASLELERAKLKNRQARKQELNFSFNSLHRKQLNDTFV